MKTKWIFILLSVLIALFIISSQAVAAPQEPNPKATPPGLSKTPAAKSNKAAGKTHGKHENYKGTITAVDDSSITLDLRDETTVTIALTAETDFKTRVNKNAPTVELATGMTVMVQAIRGEDDSLTAKRVVLIPGKPAKVHRVGIVTDYTPGVSITIQAHDEQLYTFMIDEDTKILPVGRVDLLDEGAHVTIISHRDPGVSDPTAMGIVVHPSIVKE